jgi:hypothetical protein
MDDRQVLSKLLDELCPRRCKSFGGHQLSRVAVPRNPRHHEVIFSCFALSYGYRLRAAHAARKRNAQHLKLAAGLLVVCSAGRTNPHDELARGAFDGRVNRPRIMHRATCELLRLTCGRVLT